MIKSEYTKYFFLLPELSVYNSCLIGTNDSSFASSDASFATLRASFSKISKYKIFFLGPQNSRIRSYLFAMTTCPNVQIQSQAFKILWVILDSRLSMNNVSFDVPPTLNHRN